MTTTEVRPKESKGTLELMANTIAVANGLVFDYYPIKLGEKRGPYIDLVKVPPLIVEGFVTVGKQLFQVSYKDYIRRRVNVTNPYRVTASQQCSNHNVVQSIPDRDQQAIKQCVEPILDEAANLAWKDQIDSLLHSYDPQEEWYPEDFA